MKAWIERVRLYWFRRAALKSAMHWYWNQYRDLSLTELRALVIKKYPHLGA